MGAGEADRSAIAGERGGGGMTPERVEVTNRVSPGPNGYWNCSCGQAMMFVDHAGFGPRRMVCCNRDCPHFEVLYREPTFQAERV